MKYVVVFGALALALLFNVTQVSSWSAKICLLSGALCFGGVALAYAGAGPRVFLKSTTGRLTLWSWLLFWPYHALNYSTLWLLWRRGDLFSEIEENLWLGARLSEKDAQEWSRPNMSILDVAGELSENRIFQSATHYLSLPTLDRRAPRLEDLRRGADWIEQQRKVGPVYVHCALGHGRSATFMAAYLLKSGRVQDVPQALSILRQQRPSIDLSPSQIQLLHQL